MQKNVKYMQDGVDPTRRSDSGSHKLPPVRQQNHAQDDTDSEATLSFLAHVKNRVMDDLVTRNHLSYTIALAQANLVLDTIMVHEDSELWVAIALIGIRILVAIFQENLATLQKAHRTESNEKNSHVIELLNEILDWIVNTVVIILVFLATSFCKKVMNTNFSVPIVMMLSIAVLKIWIHPKAKLQ